MFYSSEQLTEYARVLDELMAKAVEEKKLVTREQLARRLFLVSSAGPEFIGDLPKYVLSEDGA